LNKIFISSFREGLETQSQTPPEFSEIDIGDRFGQVTM
jgi:hypothetical protein